MTPEQLITIRLNDRRATVAKSDYVQRKTKDLREFGYPKLTESEVTEQLERLLAGKGWTNVIGCMMESDDPKPVKPKVKR